MKHLFSYLLLSFCFLMHGCQSPMVAYQEMPPHDRLKSLQEDLITLGYLEVGSADGIAGLETESAIKKYQAEKNKPVDGLMSYELYRDVDASAVWKSFSSQLIVKKTDQAQASKTETSTQQGVSTSGQLATNDEYSAKDRILVSNIPAPKGSPDLEVIEKAIRSELKNKVPGKWVGMTINGKNPRYKSMAIDKWGLYSDELKYWPVRIHVVGVADVVNPMTFRSTLREFDALAEFRFIKNDFGEWQSVFNAPSIFGY